MIAQGEFRKLLLADTKERLPIFRKIFCTDNFLDLQRRLADEAKTLYGEVENKRRSVLQYIDGAICEEEIPEAKELKEAKAQTHDNKMTTGEMRDVIEKVQRAEEERSKRHNEEQERLKSEIDVIDKRLEQYGTYLRNKQLHDQQVERKRLLEQATKTACEKAVAEALAKQPEIDKLVDEIGKIKLLMPKYALLKQCGDDILKKQRERQRQQSLLEDEKALKVKLEADINRKEQELAALNQQVLQRLAEDRPDLEDEPAEPQN